MVINNRFVTYATQQDVKDKRGLPVYIFLLIIFWATFKFNMPYVTNSANDTQP